MTYNNSLQVDIEHVPAFVHQTDYPQASSGDFRRWHSLVCSHGRDSPHCGHSIAVCHVARSDSASRGALVLGASRSQSTI